MIGKNNGMGNASSVIGIVTEDLHNGQLREETKTKGCEDVGGRETIQSVDDGVWDLCIFWVISSKHN